MPDVSELYQQHAPSIYWSAYSITRNEQTAMDIMQSVFLRALEHANTVSILAPAQARSWLFTTARNCSIDNIRRQKREMLLPEEEYAADIPDSAALPDAAAINNEQRRAIFQSVDALPEKYRQPILLYYFAGMRQTEIAEHLDINDSTLRSLLKRGKARLQQELTEGGVLYDGQ